MAVQAEVERTVTLTLAERTARDLQRDLIELMQDTTKDFRPGTIETASELTQLFTREAAAR